MGSALRHDGVVRLFSQTAPRSEQMLQTLLSRGDNNKSSHSDSKESDRGRPLKGITSVIWCYDAQWCLFFGIFFTSALPPSSATTLIWEGVWALSKNCRRAMSHGMVCLRPIQLCLVLWLTSAIRKCAPHDPRNDSSMMTRHSFPMIQPQLTDEADWPRPAEEDDRLGPSEGVAVKLLVCYHLKALKLQQAFTPISASLWWGRSLSSSCWTKTQRNLKYKRYVCVFFRILEESWNFLLTSELF